MKETCPHCQRPIYRDLQSIVFKSGKSPLFTMEIVIEAEWCPVQDCYQRIQLRNHIDSEKGSFVDEVVRVRDLIYPIAEGKIKRGRRISQYDLEEGLRATTMKDARPIAKRAIDRLNAAINKFTEGIFR